jgi:hypothetical protein
MRIIDGVATLRASYSGFLQWIHVIALAAFLFPYMAFVTRQWFNSKFVFSNDGATITLWEALFRFIWNGGQNWQAGWHLAMVPFTAFAFSLAYNVLRGMLLWKTKKLELIQEASGLPAIFSLTGLWGWLYRAAQVGFYCNLFVVAVHTFHFLGQRIPIE